MHQTLVTLMSGDKWLRCCGLESVGGAWRVIDRLLLCVCVCVCVCACARVHSVCSVWVEPGEWCVCVCVIV